MAFKSKCVLVLIWLLFLMVAGRAQRDAETGKPAAGVVPLLLHE